MVNCTYSVTLFVHGLTARQLSGFPIDGVHVPVKTKCILMQFLMMGWMSVVPVFTCMYVQCKHRLPI